MSLIFDLVRGSVIFDLVRSCAIFDFARFWKFRDIINVCLSSLRVLNQGYLELAQLNWKTDKTLRQLVTVSYLVLAHRSGLSVISQLFPSDLVCFVLQFFIILLKKKFLSYFWDLNLIWRLRWSVYLGWSLDMLVPCDVDFYKIFIAHFYHQKA